MRLLTWILRLSEPTHDRLPVPFSMSTKYGTYGTKPRHGATLSQDFIWVNTRVTVIVSAWCYFILGFHMGNLLRGRHPQLHHQTTLSHLADCCAFFRPPH
jgi:hypothetical protein